MCPFFSMVMLRSSALHISTNSSAKSRQSPIRQPQIEVQTHFMVRKNQTVKDKLDKVDPYLVMCPSVVAARRKMQFTVV